MRVLAILLVCLVSVAANAATEIRTVTAEAEGKNREEAVFNALGEAVRQVRGAEISASRQVQSVLNRLSVRNSDGSETTVEAGSVYTGDTSVRSDGLISGYRILGVTTAPDGSGKLASLEVDVPVYKAPGSSSHDNRWRLAVYPVGTSRGSYLVDGQRFIGEEVSRRLTHSIADSLVQSRRFAMLARDNESDIFEERFRMTTDDVSVAEKAMLGNSLGAEYLVVTRLTDLSVGSKETTSSLTGEKSRIDSGAVVLEARVVVPATGSIVWSRTLNMQAGHLGVGLTGDPHSAQKVIDAVGREVALQVIDVVWPPLVEWSNGKEVVINMGGELLSPGDRWDVYTLGKDIRNSHTGAGLGKQEALVATVEVTRSEPKKAYARVVNGEIEGVGHVLRRQAQGKSDRSVERVRGTRKTVCLPIDPC